MNHEEAGRYWNGSRSLAPMTRPSGPVRTCKTPRSSPTSSTSASANGRPRRGSADPAPRVAREVKKGIGPRLLSGLDRSKADNVTRPGHASPLAAFGKTASK